MTAETVFGEGGLADKIQEALARAWDEGAEAAMADERRVDGGEPTPNPYRKALMSGRTLIASAQFWSGWCLDHEVEQHELTELRLFLNKVVDHLKDERDNL